jgi:hypothetical protein
LLSLNRHQLVVVAQPIAERHCPAEGKRNSLQKHSGIALKCLQAAGVWLGLTGAAEGRAGKGFF